MMRTSSHARAPDKSRMHRLCLRGVTWHTTSHNPSMLSPLNPSSWSRGSLQGMFFTLDIIMGPLKHYMSDLQGMFHTLDITMVFLKCYQSDPLDSCLYMAIIIMFQSKGLRCLTAQQNTTQTCRLYLFMARPSLCPQVTI